MIDKPRAGQKVWVRWTHYGRGIAEHGSFGLVLQNGNSSACPVKFPCGNTFWFSSKHLFESQEDLARALILEAAGVQDG